MERRLGVLRLPLASQKIMAGVFSTVPIAGSPGRISLFQGRFVGGCSCRVPAVLWLAEYFRQPEHHWRLPNSNSEAVINIFVYQ
jgi:hypothetical protein